MRLLNCYIENFGALHDFSYDFQEGINTIHEENGWGKTTFGVFIKAMFYGLEYAPRKKIADNERKKYMPWQGGNFGGNIEFALADKTYRIERYFGKRDKEDTFVLYDCKTGLESKDYSAQIGEEIFHIDVASYERSTYIPQNGIAITMTDSINAKLSNLVENGSDIDNYENAYARLEERLKEYKKTGGRGRIPQLEEQIRVKQSEIEECRNKAAGMALIQEQIDQQLVLRQDLEKQREALEESVRMASEGREQLAKQGHYDSLKARVAELEEQKAPFERIFADNRVTEGQLAQIEKEIGEADHMEQERSVAKLNEEEKQQLCALDEFFHAGCPEMAQLEMYLGESRRQEAVKNEIVRLKTQLDVLVSQREQEKERLKLEQEHEKEQQHQAFQKAKERAEVRRGIFLTIGIFSAAVGLGSLLLPLPVWVMVIFVALGIGLVIFAIVQNPKEENFITEVLHEQPYVGEKEESYEHLYHRQMEELSADLERLETELKELEAHYHIFIEQFARKDQDENAIQVLTEIKAKAVDYQNLAERERERAGQKEQLTKEIAEKKRDIREKLAAIAPKYAAEETLWKGIEQAQADQKEYLRLVEEYEKSSAQLKEFLAENEQMDFDDSTEEENPSGDEVSLEALQEQQKQNLLEMESITEKINSYRKDMDAMSVIADMQTDYEEELENLTSELEEARYHAGILEKTMQYLKEAKESFSTHYMGAMRKGFTKYAELINRGKTLPVQLDVQLDAQLSVGGSLKGSEYFSTGKRDLIGLCIRFALIDALFEGEKPFIILDDPFVNLDDDKVDNAKKLLEEIAKEYQILYLVCHTSRA